MTQEAQAEVEDGGNWSWAAWANVTLSAASTTAMPNETYLPYHLRPETYLVPIIFSLIFVAGVLGNGTLVLIFARHRNMRSAPNTYILSLALGDLLVIITCVPFTGTVYTFESWPYGPVVCKVQEFTKDVSVGVSVFTLTALSADRFFAIVDPLHRLGGAAGRGAGGSGAEGLRSTLLVTAVIWLLAVACATPAAVNTHINYMVVNPKVSIEICYPFPDLAYARVVVLAKMVVYYVLPLAVIAVFYALMARHLLRSTRDMPQHCSQARQVRARRKVAKVVLAFVAVFAVCFFPLHVFMIWFYMTEDADKKYNDWWHTLRILGFCLSFANSCVNPVALYCVSGAFRKHFRRYLMCRWRRAPASGGSVSRSIGLSGYYHRRGTTTTTSASGRSRLQHGGTFTTSLGSSRKERYYCKSTWDTTTSLANFGSLRQLSGQVVGTQPHHTDDITVTTFMNGGVGAGGGAGDGCKT
ncbi:neuropeptide CCHamide-1 receptor-like [Schistocerca piceifrons]|uniref:neuropeptide CCHamide-1 receptor-like n=1 Tax=Schistocerca piceifrons TaxID=274613 RepID=UPI001F5F2490|nr:neuropeptide CCHamide-1 receptor-like [Schistocerca piceifrons]